MINWKDLKDPEFWQDKKKYFKKLNELLIRYFKWFVALLVIIVLVTGFLFLLKPKYDEVTSVLKSSQQKRQELRNQKKQKLEDLQKVIDSYEKISSQEEKKIKAVLSSREHKEKLFTELKQLVEKDNLVLKSVSLSKGAEKKEEDDREVTVRQENKKKKDEEKEKRGVLVDRPTPKGVEKVSVQMLVFGTNYNSIKDLLKRLEKNLPLIDVTQISFSSGGNSVNLTLETYQVK